MKLPPKQYRRCGNVYHNDDKYKEMSLFEADRILTYSPESILDIGCGSGRLALALIDKEYKGKYRGIDADIKAIEWAKENINYTFEHFDGYNARFNPKGKIHPHQFELEKLEYDFVYMYAIFPHMLLDDVVSWITQAYETLKDGGYFFTTMHTEYTAKLIDVNPENYPKGYKNEKSTLHHVVYKTALIMYIFEQIGFKVIDITDEWNSQTGYLLRK